MPSETAIVVASVSKSYDIHSTPVSRIRTLLFGRREGQEHFQALKPLSFEVERGRFLGIIGQNGSGKSTLLQLICGILTPTSGSVRVNGRIAALLELGAGFNPEFTGRENARLNAQILGISGKEFERVFPEIEAFADIGQFIDQPVKAYSSGMFVRLAFAVQACIQPDILIVDEALAVGDIFFRLKCYERLERLRENGCTIILVTHSMDDVMHYCDRVLLLHQGAEIFFGDAAEAVNKYYALGNVSAKQLIEEDADRLSEAALQMTEASDEGQFGWPQLPWIEVKSRPQTGDGLIRCIRIALTNKDGLERLVFRQFDLMHLHVEFEVLANLETPVVGFVIRTDRGIIVHGRNTGQMGSHVPLAIQKGQKVRVFFEIPIEFASGEYLLDVGFATWPAALYQQQKRVTMAELESAALRHCVVTGAASFSIIPKGSLGFDAQPFYGAVNVDSKAQLSVIP